MFSVKFKPGDRITCNLDISTAMKKWFSGEIISIDRDLFDGFSYIIGIKRDDGFLGGMDGGLWKIRLGPDTENGIRMLEWDHEEN